MKNNNEKKKNTVRSEEISGQKNSSNKRIGVAKKEMKGFDMSLELFNSI